MLETEPDINLNACYPSLRSHEPGTRIESGASLLGARWAGKGNAATSKRCGLVTTAAAWGRSRVPTSRIGRFHAPQGLCLGHGGDSTLDSEVEAVPTRHTPCVALSAQATMSVEGGCTGQCCVELRLHPACEPLHKSPESRPPLLCNARAASFRTSGEKLHTVS